MTYGEVGCFLSHYFIWMKVLILCKTVFSEVCLTLLSLLYLISNLLCSFFSLICFCLIICGISLLFPFLTLLCKVLTEDMSQALVLEDDVDFEPNFKQQLALVLEEVSTIDPNWDLL